VRPSGTAPLLGCASLCSFAPFDRVLGAEGGLPPCDGLSGQSEAGSQGVQRRAQRGGPRPQAGLPRDRSKATVTRRSPTSLRTSSRSLACCRVAQRLRAPDPDAQRRPSPPMQPFCDVLPVKLGWTAASVARKDVSMIDRSSPRPRCWVSRSWGAAAPARRARSAAAPSRRRLHRARPLPAGPPRWRRLRSRRSIATATCREAGRRARLEAVRSPRVASEAAPSRRGASPADASPAERRQHELGSGPGRDLHGSGHPPSPGPRPFTDRVSPAPSPGAPRA
jgi:hypothetical protein